MIAKSTRGSSPRAIARYVHGAGHHEEHINLSTGEPGGEVIGGTLAPEGTSDGEGWARTIERLCKRREEMGDRHIEKPVYQVSLSLAPEDRTLTRAEWNQAVQTWMEHQNLDPMQPYVVVQHDERHVHVVVSRVGFDGLLWKGYNDFYRNEDACRAIEKQFGLRELPDRGERMRKGRSSHERLDRGARAVLASGAPLERKEWVSERAAQEGAQRIAREHPRSVVPEFRALAKAEEMGVLLRQSAPAREARLAEIEPQIEAMRAERAEVYNTLNDARRRFNNSNVVVRPFAKRALSQAREQAAPWAERGKNGVKLAGLEKEQKHLSELPKTVRSHRAKAASNAVTRVKWRVNKPDIIKARKFARTQGIKLPSKLTPQMVTKLLGMARAIERQNRARSAPEIGGLSR